MAKKYVACTPASPTIPRKASRDTSSRRTRNRPGRAATSTTTRIAHDTVDRSCESRSASTPSSSRNRASEPFNAHIAAAVAASR